MLCEFYNENLEYQENLLTKYYGKHGHDVTVITSTFDSVFDYYSGSHDKFWPERFYYDGQAKIIKLKYRFNFLNKIRRYTDILPLLNKENPDLIYIHDIIPNMVEAVTYVKNNLNCRMIMDYHADYSNSGKNWFSLHILHGIIRRRYLDKTRPYISKIFSVVPAGIRFLNEVYKVPLNEIEILPLGADIDLGEESKKSLNLVALQKKYNVNLNTRVIVTGGKLGPLKQTELLVRAFKKLSVEDVCLLIIGDSAEEDRQYQDALLKECTNVTNIQFTGWLDKYSVYEHLAISHVAVFPASQSILWQQAISMGLPLIVGNIGDQSIDYLNLYNNIIIFDKSDINEENIKICLDKVLTDNSLYKEMCEGASRVSQECLDWNKLIDVTLRYNKR